MDTSKLYRTLHKNLIFGTKKIVGNYEKIYFLVKMSNHNCWCCIFVYSDIFSPNFYKIKSLTAKSLTFQFSWNRKYLKCRLSENRQIKARSQDCVKKYLVRHYENQQRPMFFCWSTADFLSVEKQTSLLLQIIIFKVVDFPAKQICDSIAITRINESCYDQNEMCSCKTILYSRL